MPGVNLPDLALGLKQIGVGATANDGQGDSIRSAFQKFNFNMEILAETSLEGLTEFKNLYVNPSLGSSNNPGSLELPFSTIQSAVDYAYTKLLTRDVPVAIILMPGSYTEPVIISGRPIGARSTTVDLVIKKHTSAPSLVGWSLNVDAKDYCISMSLGARVRIQDIEFTSAGEVGVNEKKTFISLESGCYLETSNVTYKSLGDYTTPKASHLSLKDSVLNFLGNCKVSGTTYTHLIADEDSYVVSSSVTSSTLSAEGNFIVSRMFEVYHRSSVNLLNSNFSLVGSLSGVLSESDFGSEVNVQSYPGTLTAGIQNSLQVVPTASFVNPVLLQSGFRSTGSNTFTSPSFFQGQASFTNNVTLAGVNQVTGSLEVPALPITDNSSKAASTAFVQTTVQDKIVSSLPVATDQLFGIVKTNVASSNPVVYVKDSLDVILAGKSNVNSPLFTGEPKAPTRSITDNTDSLATTKFVKDVIGAQTFLPAGAMVMWGAASPPTGYLLCNGDYVSRAAYPDLFSAIQTTYGSTDVINFRLPDGRDRSPRGSSGTRALGTSSGSDSLTLLTANLPSHAHTVNDLGHTHLTNDPGHAHSVSDPGHLHTIFSSHRTDGGGTNSLVVESAAVAGENQGPYSYIERNATNTNIIGHSSTNVAINGSSTNVTIQSSSSGITINNTGSGTALNITNPNFVVNYIIKT